MDTRVMSTSGQRCLGGAAEASDPAQGHGFHGSDF